jgi:hypothetical protein
MVQGWISSNDFSSDVAGTGDGWLIQTATFESSTLEHYKNSQLIDTRTHSYATDLQQMVLGAELDSNPYLDMEVAAVIVYDRALSDSERQQVEDHLDQKYLSQQSSNQAPTATDDTASVTAGQSTTVDVLANDSDSDGSLNASSVQVTSQPVTGTATVESDGAISYSAPVGASGDVTFTYTVADDDGATSNEATVTVTVVAANDAPTANDDSATVSADQSVTIDVLANDSDSDGTLNTSSVTIVSQPANGTASVDPSTGEITYTHDGAETTSDSFTYSVADDDGATDTAAVTIAVEQLTPSLPVTSGLVTHLEADQGVTTSGGSVTEWADQSSTGIYLSAAGDPQLQSNALNGQPAISLDGNGDKLVRTGDLSGLPSGAQNRTMFVVTKYDNANDWAGTAFGNGANNQAFGLTVKGGSGALTVQGWGNDLVSGTQGTGDGWLSQSAVVANDQVTHYQNGSLIDSGSKTYDTTLDAPSSKFVIGEEIAGNGYNDMEIAAVIVYDRALSDSERQQVEQYLADKYGVN